MSKGETKFVQASAPWGLILVVVLAVLKTTGVILWPWSWVFAPIWAPLVLGLVAVLFGVMIAAVAAMLGK